VIFGLDDDQGSSVLDSLKTRWHTIIIYFRAIGIAAGFILLLVGTIIALVKGESLSIVAAAGIWLYVAREGYLLLFSVTLAVVSTTTLFHAMT